MQKKNKCWQILFFLDISMSIIIRDPQEMVLLGRKLSQEYEKILLHGDLWSGKTTFAKGFAQGLNIHPDEVQSPTYTYTNIYQNKLVHADLYRIEHADQILNLGIHETFISYPYLIVERPKFPHVYFDDTMISVHIYKKDLETREVVIRHGHHHKN